MIIIDRPCPGLLQQRRPVRWGVILDEQVLHLGAGGVVPRVDEHMLLDTLLGVLRGGGGVGGGGVGQPHVS